MFQKTVEKKKERQNDTTATKSQLFIYRLRKVIVGGRRLRTMIGRKEEEETTDAKEGDAK